MSVDERLAKLPPPGIAVATNAWTRPFWEAAREHRLALPRCADCALYRMPPTPFCPRCRSQAIDWVPPPGEATLYSYTVVQRAVVPGTKAHLPYVPAVIDYAAAGVRLISNVVGSRLGDLAVGRPLELGWHDLPDGWAIPVYRLRAA